MIIYNVHPVNPQRRFLDSAAKILRNEGGIAVYPTDTMYGMGACVSNPKAIEKISRLLAKDKQRSFTFICSSFSQVSNYAHLSNAHFKLLKRYLPGPFTFILNATNLVPKKICPKRKTVGIRIPDCRVTCELVEHLGEPLANTSINVPDNLVGDPEQIRPAVLNDVDVMLDAGVIDDPTESTIVDLTNDSPVVIREGKGIFTI